MMRQVAPANANSSSGTATATATATGSTPVTATATATTTATTTQPQLAPVALNSQPISKPVELPPQYRPRKQRKQVNVACQPCRKRRSKCTGTAPCTRCVVEGNECVFDGRKDAHERNRELRTSEKALSKVFRVLRKADASEASSAALSLSHIRRLAQQNPDFHSFARELFDLDEKAAVNEHNGFERLHANDEDKDEEALRDDASPSSARQTTWSPATAADGRRSPVGESLGSTNTSRNNSILARYPSKRPMAGFGNLPFSSAIRANGYPVSIQQQQVQNLSYAEHSLLPLHTFENETLGRAYLSFRDAALQMMAGGTPVAQVLGPTEYIDLDLYFRDRTPDDGHNVSTFVCEIIKNLANPDDSAKLATLVLLAPMIRWTLFPTADNYAKIPLLMRPLPSQRFIPHSPALDLAPHPAIREALMQNFNDEWLTPENQCIAAPTVNWRRRVQDAVYYDHTAGCTRFTKEFEDHVVDPNNWTFFKGALDVFPYIQSYGARIVDLDDEDGAD